MCLFFIYSFIVSNFTINNNNKVKDFKDLR